MNLQQAVFILFIFVAMLGVPMHSRSETLSEVYALAQKNDAVLKAQEAGFKASQEAANIARSALLPQIYLTVSRSEANTDDSLFPPAGLDYDTDTDNTNITASQTLFNLEYWHNYKSGKRIGDKAEAQFRSEQQQLIVRVVEAYTDVLQAIDNYTTAKAEEAALARQLDQTKQRFDVGLVAITDVLEAQSSYDQAHVNVLSSKGAIGIAFEALDTITGTKIHSIAPLSDDYVIKSPEPLQREAWVEKALANNADLKASEFAMSAALENAKAKRAGHLPTVTATYEHNDTQSDNDPLAASALDVDRQQEVATIALRVPLFAGGGISATRRQAWEQYNAANEQFIYTQRRAVQTARSYHLAVTTGVERVKAQKQAILSAQSALDATNAGYDAGTRNIVDVLNAERAVYNAQRLWHRDRYQFISDISNLFKAAGELSPAVIENANQFVIADNQIARKDFDD